MFFICDFNRKKALNIAQTYLPKWSNTASDKFFTEDNGLKHMLNSSLIDTIHYKLRNGEAVRTIRDSKDPKRKVLGLVNYTKKDNKYIIHNIASNPDYNTGRVSEELRRKFNGKKAIIQSSIPEAEAAYRKGGWKYKNGEWVNND